MDCDVGSLNSVPGSAVPPFLSLWTSLTLDPLAPPPAEDCIYLLRITENKFTHPVWGFYSFTQRNKNYKTIIVWFCSFSKFKIRIEIFTTCPKVILKIYSLDSVDSSPVMTTLWVDLNSKHKTYYFLYLYNKYAFNAHACTQRHMYIYIQSTHYQRH